MLLSALAQIDVRIVDEIDNSVGTFEIVTLVIASFAAAGTIGAVAVAMHQTSRAAKERANEARADRRQREAEAIVDVVANASNASALYATTFVAFDKLVKAARQGTCDAELDSARAALSSVEAARQAAHAARFRVRALSGDSPSYAAVASLVELIDGQRKAGTSTLAWAETPAYERSKSPDLRGLFTDQVRAHRERCLDLAYALISQGELPVQVARWRDDDVDLLARGRVLALDQKQLERVARDVERAHRKLFQPAVPPIARATSSDHEVVVSIRGGVIGRHPKLSEEQKQTVRARVEVLRGRPAARRRTFMEDLTHREVVDYTVGARFAPLPGSAAADEPGTIVETFRLGEAL